MRISIIAAVASNGVIGRDNDLPWRLSADLKRFKRLTMGHHLLMGRKTFESIGRALPGRTTIVVSRREPALPEGVVVASSLESALQSARSAGEDEVFIAGGAEIYALAMPLTDRIYLTRIDAPFDGDTHFPDLDESLWDVRHEEVHPADHAFPWKHRFQILDRRVAETESLTRSGSAGLGVE